VSETGTGTTDGQSLERARGGIEQPTQARAAASRILEERARELARPLDQAAAPVDTLELLVFSRGSGSYAVEAGETVEVVVAGDPTPVPGTPPAVAGVVNHRGRILTVVDVARLLAGEEEAAAEGFVVAVASRQACFGIRADSVSGVVEIERGELLQPARLGDERGGVVRALARGMVAVLDLDALAGHPGVLVRDDIE
jgi:purine-binding chemotaxis protein CheW